MHYLKHYLNYSWGKGRADLIAALTVAAIALPEGIAYALIAGVDPRFGLYSAIFITAIASIRASNFDAGLVLITTVAALLIGIEYSILTGVALSILLFVPRAAKLKAAELFVSNEGVVRERLTSDPPCTSMILFDLEGEIFFGAAPDLDRYLDELKERAIGSGIRFIVLRLKRVRNPDIVCIEQLEHELHDAQKLGITVLLAGVRPDLARAFSKLGFGEWFPKDRIFLEKEDDDTDSATLKAVRQAYNLLGDDANTCEHCASIPGKQSRNALYYLV